MANFLFIIQYIIMKKILLLFFILVVLLSLSPASHAQDCYIIMKIKGTIVLESSGNQLSVNDQVCTGDNIIFKSSDAVAIVHSSSKGRYTIKPGKNRSNELEGIIKESVASALSKSKANLETRAEVNLKNKFGDAYCLLKPIDILIFGFAISQVAGNTLNFRS